MRHGKDPMAGHLPGLDGVRGLAILLVMAVHFIGDATPHTGFERLLVKAGNYGLLGVDLFFVLSGFLITGLLLDAKGKPGYFRNFYARRTLRIFPLYYLVLVVLFGVLPLLRLHPEGLELAQPHQGWVWAYLTNVYLSKHGAWVLPYVGHFWSLAVEEHFYLVWPLVVFLAPRSTLEKICLGAIAFSLALRIGLSVGGVNALAVLTLTPCRLDTLCVGGLLAAVARRDATSGAWLVARAKSATLALGGALLVLSGFCAWAKTGLAVLHPLRGSLYALFFGGLILLSLDQSGGAAGRLFRARWLRELGRYSYGLYVYHGVISYWMILVHAEDRLGAALGSHGRGMAAQAVLGFAASLLVSVASFEVFEKPFLLLKRHFETRRRPTDSLPSILVVQEAPERSAPDCASASRASGS